MSAREEGERPGPGGQRQRLADHAAMGEDGHPLAGMGGGEPADGGADPGGERRGGLGAGDHVPAFRPKICRRPDRARPPSSGTGRPPSRRGGPRAAPAPPGRSGRAGPPAAPPSARCAAACSRRSRRSRRWPAGRPGVRPARARLARAPGPRARPRAGTACRARGRRLAVPDEQDVGRAGGSGTGLAEAAAWADQLALGTASVVLWFRSPAGPAQRLSRAREPVTAANGSRYGKNCRRARRAGSPGPHRVAVPAGRRRAGPGRADDTGAI